ncbi:MAG: SIR2 family NAD-dependent protein deacylase [Terriglobia bacterium]
MGAAGIAVGPTPPYGPIWNVWRQGRVIPFLGAGASCAGRPSGAAWDPRGSAFLPTGSELSCLLAQETGYPATELWERSDLAKVCSYYVDVSDRPNLRNRLRLILNRDYRPGPLHQLLAEIPVPQVIVVTNYDTLVEQAFDEAGKPYDLVVYPADSKEHANSILWRPHADPEPRFESPKKLYIDLSKTTVIFKMHGSITRATDKWDHFVITEEDYVEFLSRMTTNSAVPAFFYQYFRERSFLFLGYGLRDWNLRLVLKNMSNHFASRNQAAASGHDEPPKSWGIQRNPSDVERALWDRRNVKIFDCDLDDFAAKLRETRSVMGG